MKKSIITRREKAKKRQAEYDKLTVVEKIARLDVKLGNGVGAKKQRERLAKQKDRPKEVKEVKEVKKAKEAKEESHSKKPYKKGKSNEKST